MFDGFFRKLFGSANERRIKNYRPRVDAINALEKELEGLSDEALRARTDAVQEGDRRGQVARGHSGAGLRDLPRGGQAHASDSAISTCS